MAAASDCVCSSSGTSVVPSEGESPSPPCSSRSGRASPRATIDDPTLMRPLSRASIELVGVPKASPTSIHSPCTRTASCGVSDWAVRAISR
eukprot:1991818-Prymnesium_polylepis.1